MHDSARCTLVPSLDQVQYLFWSFIDAHAPHEWLKNTIHGIWHTVVLFHEKVQDYTKRFQIGHVPFLVLEMKKMVRNAQLQIWRTMKFYRFCDWARIQRKRTSSFPSIRCVGSMSFENAKWNVFDALQRWHDECRSFISHKKFSKQAQCSRSSRGLVWWVDSADFWSVMFNHWEFNCARTVGSQIGSRRSEYFD